MPKDALLQRSNPVSHVTKASARADSLAKPLDPLGVQAKTYEYNSKLAEALQGPQAAQITGLLSIPGSVVNAQA